MVQLDKSNGATGCFNRLYFNGKEFNEADTLMIINSTKVILMALFLLGQCV